MKPIGHTILRKESVHNSMDWAREELPNVEHGTLFLAQHHETTRGRQGREWRQADGQLLLTFILKPEFAEHDYELKIPALGMALALGFLQPLNPFGVGIKWPNDFVYNGKKVGGMLMQAVWHEKKCAGYIVGFGLNVNNCFDADDELYECATSLKSIIGKNVEVESLQEQLLTAVDGAFRLIVAGNEEHVYMLWKKSLVHLNHDICVHQHDGREIRGVLEDVRRDGSAVIVRQGERTVVPFYVADTVG